MGNNAVKGVIIIMLLVIVSVIIGVQISGSFRESMGSFFVIAAVAISFAILLLGKQLWKMLFILPYFIAVLPFHLPPLPWRMVISVPILACWSIMWALRQVRFRWLSLPALDISFFILILYMGVNYYRHPVVLEAFESDYEYIGGRDYIIALLAVAYYVAVSVIPITYEDLMKLLKWIFICLIVSQIIRSFSSILHISTAGGNADAADSSLVGEELMNNRFGHFMVVSTTGLCYLYARYPLSVLCRFGRPCFLAFLSLCGVLLSGFRSHLIALAMYISILATVKRELSILALCALPVYIVLVGLGNVGVWESAPFGIQRTLMALPGVRVSDYVAEDATESVDFRVRMWKNAMDPRTGLIKDYVWGDGFQFSRKQLERSNVAAMRGDQRDFQQYMEEFGEWHNGFITYIHRLGFVGLVIIQIFLLVSAYYTVSLLNSCVGTKTGGYIVPLVLMYFPIVVGSAYMVYLVRDVFNSVGCIATCKLFYGVMRQKGLIKPLFRRERYVPMSIREHEMSH